MSTERTYGEEITTTLTIVDEDDAAVDADDTPEVTIYIQGEFYESIDQGDITHQSTGVYSFTWTPIAVATYVIHWEFEVGQEEYEDDEVLVVVSDITGTSDSSEDGTPGGDDEPDIGEDNTCTVTATFYDGSGDYMEGVYVRFTPLKSDDSFLDSGTVVMEVTASSGSDGSLSLVLVRGVKGMISVSGLGIVREVEVPNVATVSLRDLVDLGEDLLTVQRPQFKRLPRRS